MKSGAARARLASTMRTHRDRAPRMTCMSYRRACPPRPPHVGGRKSPHLVIVVHMFKPPLLRPAQFGAGKSMAHRGSSVEDGELTPEPRQPASTSGTRIAGQHVPNRLRSSSSRQPARADEDCQRRCLPRAVA